MRVLGWVAAKTGCETLREIKVSSIASAVPDSDDLRKSIIVHNSEYQTFLYAIFR